MAKQNYRQMKKQKETARKARHVEKLQKRQKGIDQPEAGETAADQGAAPVAGDAASTPSTGE